MADSEAQLIDKSRRGDATAFERLIKPYEGKVYTFLSRMCGESEAAKDMAQETFLRAFDKIRRYRGGSKFSTWLFRVAVNNCKMHKRGRGRRPEAPLEIEVGDYRPGPGDQYDEAELKLVVAGALQKLPPAYRSVLVLSEYDGLSGPEIAKVMNISLANVKVRLRRGREKLKEIFKDRLIPGCCDCDKMPAGVHKKIIECLKGDAAS